MNKSIGTKKIIINGSFHFSIEREIFISTNGDKIKQIFKVIFGDTIICIYLDNKSTNDNSIY